MNSNEKIDVTNIKQKLLDFQRVYEQYANEIKNHQQSKIDEIRHKLQIMEPPITQYILQIVGPGSLIIGDRTYKSSITHGHLISTALMGGDKESYWFDTFKRQVDLLINRAIGNIEASLWPPKEPEPILIIRDTVLKERCLDLLQAPGKFDRVVREATLILEDRLRNRISHERLSTLIPDSGKQTADNLVNTLLSPSAPILLVSTDQRERAAFQKIMVGVFAYLRNPFHHHIDDTTEWSWAWSIVGFIDHLLHELESCEESK